MLFFAQVSRLAGNIVVRTHYLNRVDSSPDDYGILVRESYLWTIRNVPELLVLVFMLALILGRLWCNNPSHDCAATTTRRKGDVDGEHRG